MNSLQDNLPPLTCTCNNYFFVEWVENKAKRDEDSLIELSDDANDAVMRERPIPSRVIACPPDNDLKIKNGDYILFLRHGAKDMFVDGEKRLLVVGTAIMGNYSVTVDESVVADEKA